MEDRYLFRAKRIDNGEWVIGNLITNVFFRLGQSIPYILCPDKAKYDCFEDFTEENGIFEVRPDTICQCTGLKDKNGKLIWENDVVKKGFYIDYNSVYQEEYVPSVISEEYVGTIKFEHFAWAVGIFNDHLKCILPICELSEHSEDIKYFEIVGNIFDNPKLLESEGN